MLDVAIHAPAGTATLEIHGGDFHEARFGVNGLDPCEIVTWTKNSFAIKNTKPEAGDDGHIFFRVDWSRHPLSLGSFVLKCTSGASMWIRKTGTSTEYKCAPVATETYDISLF